MKQNNPAPIMHDRHWVGRNRVLNLRSYKRLKKKVLDVNPKGTGMSSISSSARKAAKKTAALQDVHFSGGFPSRKLVSMYRESISDWAGVSLDFLAILAIHLCHSSFEYFAGL